MINALIQEEIQEIERQEGFQEGFKVDNIDGANWCFRKIRALKEQMNETNRIAYEEVNRIETWRKKENENAESTITYFEGLLTEYYRLLKSENPKAKVSTPYGKISSRKSKKWNWQNVDETLSYLKENGFNEFIRVKEEIDKVTLKKTFKNGVNTETGELIPGIEVVEKESITIKVE